MSHSSGKSSLLFVKLFYFIIMFIKLFKEIVLASSFKIYYLQILSDSVLLPHNNLCKPLIIWF